MSDVIRLRKHLAARLQDVVWPDGIVPVAFESVEPLRIHRLLDVCFPGLVAPCNDWYGNLTHDSEFDAALCIPALAADGQLAGFIQCWTSSFIKDLAVAPDYRGKGVGAALMNHAFVVFAGRSSPHVDLKVRAEEQPARRLYARLGMVEVPL